MRFAILLSLIIIPLSQHALSVDLEPLHPNSDSMVVTDEMIAAHGYKGTAEVLVARFSKITRPVEIKSADEFVVNYSGQDSELQIWFEGKNLKDFLEKGVFNAHQNPLTRSQNYLFRRVAFEVGALRTYLFRQQAPDFFKIQENRKALFPRYGVVAYKGSDFPRIGSMELSDEYGEFALILKNNVKRRATWTQGDSIQGASGPYPMDRGKVNVRYNSVYLEAQIWGPVDLEDIEAVLVPRTVTREQLEFISARGLNAYFYDLHHKVLALRSDVAIRGKIREIPVSCEKLFQ